MEINFEKFKQLNIKGAVIYTRSHKSLYIRHQNDYIVFISTRLKHPY